ncbi:hypothetical protein T4E_6156 [Trichinella pseudospiralis]|uniref:Uncharacterized protein n=1 Tax=Trichinella pseudospiralis TaxID=6337 RepID=A0A0V0XJK1_TRIPS|nr:hypothetical protein T4E_6156 [Trichinella pseudospiralis]
MQMAPYKNLYKTRSRSNEYKRHVRIHQQKKNLYPTENADDTKQIADDRKQIEDDTKQNCGMKTYGICGSPRVPIL